MSASPHESVGTSSSKAGTSPAGSSVNTKDSENTTIRKTIRKWYDTAKSRTGPIYKRNSFGSFGNLGLLDPALASDTPTGPPQQQNTKMMDPDAVGWEDENDPENPMNWSGLSKGVHLFIVFLICFVSPFASSVFAPALNDMMEDFADAEIYLAAFAISSYVLGYAVGPLIIGPLSEVYGRLIMYHICNVVFTVFTTLCASVHNFRTLAILRFLAGCGGASAFTLGPATVADLVPFEKRNGMYAILGTAYNLGPAVSPIIGDYIHHSMGWRWIFWITGIAGGVCTVATLVLSESYEPVVLRRKVQRLRKETGNPNLHSVRDTNGSVPSSRILVRAMLRPLRMLLLLPNVFLVSLLTAVGYGYMYVLYTTIPSVFLVDPFWHTRNIGLAYLATGFGCVLGMVIGGPLSDFIVKRRLACRDTRPENRLIPMIYFWPLVSIGLIVFGWTAEKQVAWYWPQLGTAIFGVSAMSAILFCGTYVVDAYTVHAASAAAATTVLRSLFGGLLPLFAPKMQYELQVGWMYTTLGLIALLFWPVPIYFYKYGGKQTRPKRSTSVV